MEDRNSLNPIFIMMLAVIPLVNTATKLSEVCFFALLVALTFIITISITSILENLTHRNLRFFVFMIIACAIITSLNYVFTTFPNALYVDAGSKIMNCLLSAGILSLYIIYYSNRREMTHYFYKLLLQVPAFMGFYVMFGFFREVMGYGTIWGYSMGFDGLAFFRTMSGALLIIAFLGSFINAYWLKYDAKRQQYNLLVSKYKMKLNRELNKDRIDLVNASEVKNFGVSELIEEDFVAPNAPKQEGDGKDE